MSKDVAEGKTKCLAAAQVLGQPEAQDCIFKNQH
jgi:hypothetical protein